MQIQAKTVVRMSLNSGIVQEQCFSMDISNKNAILVPLRFISIFLYEYSSGILSAKKEPLIHQSRMGFKVYVPIHQKNLQFIT